MRASRVPERTQARAQAQARHALLQAQEAGVSQRNRPRGASRVALTIEWRGQLGGDLSARLRVRGRNGNQDGWVTVASDIRVADPDGAAGGPSARLAHTISIERYREYEVTFTPLASPPDDRYRATSARLRVAGSAGAATLTARLDLDRWNRRNVADVWQGRDIDPGKAGDVVSATLFGRTVQIHRAVLPRVEKTNALYEALPEGTRAAIRASLFVTGGYAVRTTTDGEYSNHSVGYAIDVNYHGDTKQNHHFQEDDLTLLRDLVEPVVRTDPALAAFRILQDSGLQQLRAAHAFNQRFPAFLADLLGMDAARAELEQCISAERNAPFYAAYFRSLREQKTRALFARIDARLLRQAIQRETDGVRKTRLELALASWTALQAWIFGIDVRDERAQQQKRIAGMIPLREDVLQMFLDAGWSWGGDWKAEKDYMHFEDTEALQQVKRSRAAAPPAPLPAPSAPLGAAPAHGPAGRLHVEHVEHIAAGDEHTCVLLRGGAVRCWGAGGRGRLGTGATASIGDDESPAAIPDVALGGRAVQVVAGKEHTCALLDTGGVRCWGAAQSGQLGYGNRRDIGDDESPASAGDVPLGEPAVQLTASGMHTCALLGSGRVRCWGLDTEGQLGLAFDPRTIGDDEVPTAVPAIDFGARVEQLASSFAHTCARFAGGAVRCWGPVLGAGIDKFTPAAARPPVALGAPAAILGTGTAATHTCAITTAGRVRCWGLATGGPRGHDKSVAVGVAPGRLPTPAELGDLPMIGRVVQVAPGSDHTCVLTDAGQVRCWGDSRFGGLGQGRGQGTVQAARIPVERAALVDLGGRAVGIAAGGFHTCALLDTGRVRCWGWNRSGQLGYGTPENVGAERPPAAVGDVPL